LILGIHYDGEEGVVDEERVKCRFRGDGSDNIEVVGWNSGGDDDRCSVSLVVGVRCLA
jgi:hypothetical protein